MSGAVITRDRSAWRDRLVSGVVGLLVFLGIYLYSTQGLDPAYWNDAAAALGVRPPKEIFSGYWRGLAGWLFEAFGYDAALLKFRVLGALAAGFSAYCVCRITSALLGYLVRTAVNYKVWRNWIVPFASAFSALVFGLSGPLWRCSRILSPDSLKLAVLLGAIHLSLRYLTRGSRWRLFPLMTVMGLLAAESPLAFLLPVWFMATYFYVNRLIMDGVRPPNPVLPIFEDLPKWRMFFLFLFGLGLGIYLNCWCFEVYGGAKAWGWQTADIYFHYGNAYWAVLRDCSGLLGWILGSGFALLPLTVAASVFPRAVTDERPMPFSHGVLLCLAGFLTFLQSGVFLSSRFWTFSHEGDVVSSGYLLSFYVFAAALTLGLVVAAFAMECQRKYLVNEAERPGPLLRYLVPVLAVALLAGIAWRIDYSGEAAMQQLVDDAIAETVRECGDAKFLFTDGRLDAGVEIEAKRQNKELHTLDMMSGAEPWEVYLRSRYFDEQDEDYNWVKHGVSVLLRIWAGEKPQGMKDSAIQLGFELWRRDRRPLPRQSGVVAREVGLTEAEAAEGVKRAKALVDRIVAQAEIAAEADVSPALASAYSAVQWRLSRFARLRHEPDEAERIDSTNGALKRMLTALEYERMRTFVQLTPREGLQAALRKADFHEARRYSAALLNYDEDDPEANFAMGMSALTLDKFADAERYLKRVLVKRPKEPAALNNLSIICRKQKRYAESEKYARAALELLPDSPEVQATLDDCLKRRP